MSWFLTVLNLTAEAKQRQDDEPWPENSLLPLGTRAEIHTLIAKLFHVDDYSDPFWISVRDEQYSMEIVLDDDDPVTSMGLRHGSIDAARLIHEHTGWEVFDPNGELIDFETI